MPTDVGEAVAELGSRRSRRGGGRMARRKPQRHGEGDDRQRRGHEVHARRADPADSDGDPGDRRSEDTRRAEAHLPEHDGVGEQRSPDELAGHRHAGRSEEGKRQRLKGGGHEEHPVLDEVERHAEPDPGSRDGQAHEAHGDHQPFGETVGEHAAERRGDKHRHPEGHVHPAETGVRAGQLVGQPAAGDDLRLHGEEGDQPGDEQSPVLRHDQRGERRRPRIGELRRRVSVGSAHRCRQAADWRARRTHACRESRTNGAAPFHRRAAPRRSPARTWRCLGRRGRSPAASTLCPREPCRASRRRRPGRRCAR